MLAHLNPFDLLPTVENDKYLPLLAKVGIVNKPDPDYDRATEHGFNHNHDGATMA